jgi:uncharacterized membrane protein
MLQLARQQIAEYFLMLVILLIIENKHDISNRLLLIFFSFSIVVSHYGISYIILASIISSLLLLSLYRKYLDNTFPNNTINITFTLLFTVFLLTWYIYVSSSSALYTIVNIGKSIIENFISDFANPDEAQGLLILSKKTVTPLHEIAKIMHIITQIFITIGIGYLLTKIPKKYLKFNVEYMSFCIVFFLMLLAAIVVPNFSSSLNTSRLYQITLIVLAPCCVIGGIILFRILFKFFQSRTKENDALILKILSFFFAIYLLFNSGWIYEIAGDSPVSYSLNSELDLPKFNDQDVAGLEWLYQVNKVEDNIYYADGYRWLLLLSRYGRENIYFLPENINQVMRNSYIYLSTYNTINNEVYIIQGISDYINVDSYISSKNQIYNNGGAKVYYQ